MHKGIIFFITVCMLHAEVFAQCCGAGSGSPVAGGVSQGVLQEGQMELNANFQYVSTTKFMHGGEPDENFLDSYTSKYGYFRSAYGLTKDLTMSVEAGYHFDKTQIGLNNRDTISTSGWGDLVLFPRYDIINKADKAKRTEITLGLGIKIPIGDPEDTLRQIEPFSGTAYYVLKPPAIRTTSGGNDFIFYGFIYRGYLLKNYKIFSNILYVRKGWNELGERSGDYASIGLFASHSFISNLGTTLSLRGEWIGQMQTNADLALYGNYNYDPDATGSKKLFVVPQLSYSFKSVTFYALSEIPLYQYVNEQQIASQYFFTAGASYMFEPFKKKAGAHIVE